MIKIETTFDNETNKCKVNYKSEKSCTMEHLYAIQTLVEQILMNDAMMDWETIRSIINNLLVEKEKEKKKGNKNGKSNN